jgi:hypothetical protein
MICIPTSAKSPVSPKMIRPQWSAADFLAGLGRRGIVLLTVHGAVLAYPEAQLTDADWETIRQYRAVLLPMLAEAVVVA